MNKYYNFLSMAFIFLAINGLNASEGATKNSIQNLYRKTAQAYIVGHGVLFAAVPCYVTAVVTGLSSGSLKYSKPIIKSFSRDVCKKILRTMPASHAVTLASILLYDSYRNSNN